MTDKMFLFVICAVFAAFMLGHAVTVKGYIGAMCYRMMPVEVGK